jgi:tetratricopeptide (TPR) repeat protein
MSEPQSENLLPQPVNAAVSTEERADVLMVRQQYQQAIAAYRAIPEKSAVIWNKIGVCYQHMYADDEAMANYDRAIRLRHNYPEALNNLGTLFLAKKDYRQAEKLFKRAIKLDPRNPSFEKNLGTAYFAKGNIPLGIEAYRAAFSLNPNIFDQGNAPGIAEPASSNERAGLDFCMAELFARAGLKDRALDALRKSLSEGFRDRRRLLEDRDFAALRTTPAFSELMKEHDIR